MHFRVRIRVKIIFTFNLRQVKAAKLRVFMEGVTVIKSHNS